MLTAARLVCARKCSERFFFATDLSFVVCLETAVSTRKHTKTRLGFKPKRGYAANDVGEASACPRYAEPMHGDM